MLVITLEKYFSKEINFTKLLKISILHDLPEIYAGDIHAFAKDKSEKEKKEKESIEKLYKLLPNSINQNLYTLFEEYEKQTSPEAKIIKALDKLTPLIQNISTTSHSSSYRDANVNYIQTINYMDQFFQETPEFINILYKELLKEAKEKNVFNNPEKPSPKKVNL